MQNATQTHQPLTRTLGLPGKLVLGGTISTGLLLGGYITSAMALAGRMNGSALLLTSLGLFIVGAGLGFVLSAAVGLIGREESRTLKDAVRSVGKGLLYAVPACLIGAVLSGWIAMALIGLYTGKALAIGGSALAAVVGLGVFAATLAVTRSSCTNGLRRLRNAF